MLFKTIAAAITALATAFAEREKNVRLRLLTDNARELYSAKVHLLQLHDAAVTGTALDLAELRVKELADFQAEISRPAAGASTAHPAPGFPPQPRPNDLVP